MACGQKASLVWSRRNSHAPEGHISTNVAPAILADLQQTVQMPWHQVAQYHIACNFPLARLFQAFVPLLLSHSSG